MKMSKIALYGRLLLSGAALAAVLSAGVPAAFAGEAKAAAALSDVQRVLAIEEIRQLKYQWWGNVDNKKWNDALALFTSPNTKIEIDFKKPDGTAITNAKQFIEFASGPYYQSGKRRAIHLGLNPIITLKSATEADGVWFFEAIEYSMVDGKWGNADRHSWGQHFDRYVKTANGWRIDFTRFGGGDSLSTSTRYPPVTTPRQQ